MATSSVSGSNCDSLENEVPISYSTDLTESDDAAAESSHDAIQDSDALSSLNFTQLEKAQSDHFSVDDIPEPIKVLDEIISEFEESSSKPAVNSGENQSEDDGYMSLSRKNMPKKDSEEMSLISINSAALVTPKNGFQEIDTCLKSNREYTKESVKTAADIVSDQSLNQSTLPKVRTNTPLSSIYSSLPCCGVRSGPLENKMRGSSCNGERNVLGIDISAVHNAVLRGGLAKLPEPIINEHPVTIYPGRCSPSTAGVRSKRPQRILASVEKHKEVCQILNPLSSTSSSSVSSSPETGPSDSKTRVAQINEVAQATSKYNDTTVSSGNNLKSRSEDEFSEDSIEEEEYLYPCGAVPTVSNQLSPKKQASIAWEINFKKNKKKFKQLSETKSQKKYVNKNFVISESALFTNICESTSFEGIQAINELENISENSLYLNEHLREYDKPSTDNLNHYMCHHNDMLGKGTFIIRRATKKTPKAIDIFSSPANLDYGPPNFSEPVDPKQIASNYIIHQSDNFNSNPRHSHYLELGNSEGSSLKSPRDRLSLNIESQHQNLLNKEATIIQQNSVSSPEELSNPLQTECLKNSECKKSVHIHCKSTSVKDDSTYMNGTDANNSVSFKSNSASGLKNQEYPELRTSSTTTPHTDLAPTLEEDEEQYNDFSYGCAPLQQIESNISALLRGDIAVVRIGDISYLKRPLEFRPGVHKSESAKEMLLSQNQNAFGPLPLSPPTSNPDLFDYDALPPLPPSPTEASIEPNILKPYLKTTTAEIHTKSAGDEKRNRDNSSAMRHLADDLPLPPPTFDNVPPVVPPHRGHSANTIKSWSIDSNYKKKNPKMLGYGSGITTPTGTHMTSCEGAYSTKRYVNYGTKRSSKQSPREEHRLQTSCSLPETPIFARGCDIPRTPYRRQNENNVSGSRTAPRSSTSHSINMGASVVGITGGSAYGTGAGVCRQRSINHALASNEMLRLSGVPARGWYPKQRSMRPVSTENIDRLTSMRVWDSATGLANAGHSRKPLTLPPNLTPSFLNKSPREALRRVTSLLITKKKNTKDRKNKAYSENTMEKPVDITSTCPKDSSSHNNTAQKSSKKKGLFKNIWKRTKHVSLDQ